MAPFVRNNPRFSLCGLNCCLCPRFNTDGISKCPGCGGKDFSNQHPTCAVATCNKKHDNVEYCFQCSEYPCKKYQEESKCDSFISYKSVKQNFLEAKTDLKKYENDLENRYNILKTLLDNYNDGKSKGLYCLITNDMPLVELELLLSKIEERHTEMNIKEIAKQVKIEIALLETKLGMVFKLRK